MRRMEGFPARETSSQDENAMNLTGRLLEFAPGVASEQLTEKQEIALKKATFYFYKQLMLQQNKTNHLVSLPFRHSFASLINPLTLCLRLNKVSTEKLLNLRPRVSLGTHGPYRRV